MYPYIIRTLSGKPVFSTYTNSEENSQWEEEVQY